MFFTLVRVNELGGDKENPTSASKNDAKESDVRDVDKDENVGKSNNLAAGVLGPPEQQ